MCGVFWECGLNGAGDEDDDILGIGWEPTEQSKLERLAAVVDSGAAGNVSLADVCSHETQRNPRSEAGILFRGAGGDRIRDHGQRTLEVRMSDGLWRGAHSRWRT